MFGVVMEYAQSAAESAEELKLDPYMQVVHAKQQFLHAAAALEPMGIVKRNPLISVSCAFLLGFGIIRISTINFVNLLMPAAVKIGSILAEIALKKK